MSADEVCAISNCGRPAADTNAVWIELSRRSESALIKVCDDHYNAILGVFGRARPTNSEMV